MKITEIRETTVQLQGNIANALVNFSEHSISLVAIISDVVRGGRPVTGIAFDSIGRFAQGGILRERMIPRLLQAESDSLLSTDGTQFDPELIHRCIMANEKPGGHGDRCAAAGALELAFWDLNAKLNDEPAYQTISRFFCTDIRNREVPVYAAGGYYHPEKGAAGLTEELLEYQQQGYLDYKIKIGGANLSQDMQRIEAAVKVAGGGEHIAVDANGRFDIRTAMAYADAMAPFGLKWYEEAGDPLDYELNRELATHYRLPLATGENLFSNRDVQNLVRYAGMRPGIDIFQMDPGLSYGIVEYNKMLQTAEASGFSRTSMHPHGGHLINLHVVTALGLGGCESYPGVFQPFGGYSDQCLQGDGVVSATDAPGFGLEQKANLNAQIVELLQ